MKENRSGNNELTFDDVSQLLGKSKRTVSRYIKAGKLNPEKVKGKKGIPEYRFNRSPDRGQDRIKKQNKKMMTFCQLLKFLKSS